VADHRWESSWLAIDCSFVFSRPALTAIPPRSSRPTLSTVFSLLAKADLPQKDDGKRQPVTAVNVGRYGLH